MGNNANISKIFYFLNFNKKKGAFAMEAPFLKSIYRIDIKQNTIL